MASDWLAAVLPAYQMPGLKLRAANMGFSLEIPEKSRLLVVQRTCSYIPFVLIIDIVYMGKYLFYCDI